MAPRPPISIALVNVCEAGRAPGEVVAPIGLWQLSGHLRSALGDSVEVTILDMQLLDGDDPVRAVVERVAVLGPDVLGLSLAPGARGTMRRLTAGLTGRVSPDRWPLLFFGKNVATSDPEGLLREFPDSIVVQGEGEHALEAWVGRLLGRPGTEAIVNSVHGSGRGPRRRVRDLDALGMPDWSDLPGLLARSGGSVDLEFGRGCSWGACTYCAGPDFWGGPRREWVHKSVDRFVEELRVVAAAGATHVRIGDESFLSDDPEDVDRIERLARLILDEGLSITFTINARSDSVYRPDLPPERRRRIEDQLEILRAAGLRTVFLGVESGSTSQLRRYGKGLTPEVHEGAIELLRRMGIGIVAGFIMFDPLVTLDELRENAAFVRRARLLPSISSLLSATYVYRNTPLERLVRRTEASSGRRLLADFDDDLLYHAIHDFADPAVGPVFRLAQAFARSGPYHEFTRELKRSVGRDGGEGADLTRFLLRRAIVRMKELELDLLERLIEAGCDEARTRVHRETVDRAVAAVRETVDLVEPPDGSGDLHRRGELAISSLLAAAADPELSRTR